MSLKDPTSFCKTLPTVAGSLTIRLPWQLPILEASASMSIEDIEGYCKQLEMLLGQLKVTLAFMYPILRIIDCLKLLVDVVKKIVETFDPANIADIAVNLAALAAMLGDVETKCVDLFLELTFAVPTPFCKLIADIMGSLIALIDCILAMSTVSLGLGDRIAELNASGDAALLLESACLQEQKTKLDAAILQKLESIESILDIVNILIGFVPPLVLILGGSYPITTGALTIDPLGLTALRDSLVIIRDLALTCA